MSAPSFEIQGQMVALPVHIRNADSWAAQFLVNADAAQKLVDPTGLAVAQIAGRTMVNLAFVRYLDGDLDTYNELAVAFLVRQHDSKAAAVYIHQLPVTEQFSVEAGQRIWGYPKFLADIEITEHRHHVSCTLAHEGTYVLTLDLHEGGPMRLPMRNLPTYSLRDDILRRTPWDQDVHVRARIGGASLELGSHPIADELRSLGLPKRALMTTTMRGMRVTFHAAEVV
jgi:hypothetical protein